MLKKLTTTLVAAAAVTAFGAGTALADYPERPINMIVSFGAGGGTDVAARTLAPYIEENLGGSITVQNRPGAGGEVGFSALANANPDGYTIGFINVPTINAIPIQRDAGYTMDDIQPVARVVYDPGAFSVNANSDIGSLDELIEAAEENPGAITYGTTGVGTDNHLSVLEFQRMTGIDMIHIPFSGAAELRAAVLGGHVTLGTMNMSESVDDMNAGNLRVLGQMANERWEQAADVPTFPEQGFDLVWGSHRGIGVPAGVPDDILSSISQAIEAAMNNPEFREQAQNQNLPLAFLDPNDFQAELDRINTSMQELWNEEPWSD